MRMWTRKNALGGVKFKSEMDGREVAVLRSLVESVVGLLERRGDEAPTDDLAELTGMRSGNTSAPEDPTLARLLPDFHRPEGADTAESDALAEQADLNGALRSLYEPDIIDIKRAAGATILSTLPNGGGKIVLTREQADSWLTGLNDVRLALGTTLGIDADTPDQLEEDDPRAPHLDVYHWLTWMQDSLVQVLMP
ncbi:DUF2017 domain-containing protein [Rhodococcus sp. BP-149]|uniref:oxidative stress transcriptional regulator AosR n=1 Tax=unclassified Rhodococcus (in: high G+C Gram-positive bacteria) TaxID=192944 RepID=UPI001C9BA649|nr:MULTISPECIES: DUF2017 domain-containing protein [unclassified Rhodococcus (in: high G+C Gram-positive bacteria)]MBY6686107.1 DUF2017 domain-containing protein [Rhodococcus sp. BP-288]MBY6693803.1 DUF2017 domain-containing protein [Rhodococcus sp. BP-188]MBY6699600.1 DUF2017 domain-containing protein [Rhodococcus sp. BP-285]MBY6704055.1 DUF2017 domain-containing protein [Rhodococcus sp. BP-283]MBY6710796.1 DUF2017 domain-containing protein [Rhodococcus sp. BP-160]